VHFVYLTAFTLNGQTHYRNDLYNRGENTPVAEVVDNAVIALGWQTMVRGIAS
jgi:murein L,D-transpeptidase YcbB/YkuD